LPQNIILICKIILIIDVEALQNGSDGQKFNDVKGVMKDAKERFRDWRRVSRSLRVS